VGFLLKLSTSNCYLAAQPVFGGLVHLYGHQQYIVLYILVMPVLSLSSAVFDVAADSLLLELEIFLLYDNIDHICLFFLVVCV
jgi:hypothetical protein